jgi:Leucine-rich repeat (LRR) protein
LSDNQITDVSPLKNLTPLLNLTLANNQITDLSPLGGLHSLTQFNILNNPVIKDPTHCPKNDDTAPMIRDFCAGYLPKDL